MCAGYLGLARLFSTPRYPRVFSFRKDTFSIHRLTKEDKGPSPSSIAQSTVNMLSLTTLSMLKVGYNSIIPFTTVLDFHIVVLK